MHKSNICPACRKQHDKMPAICMCGQLLTKEEKGGCPFIKKDGSVCGENATKSFTTRIGGWYCPTHADALHWQNYQR